MAHIKVTLSDSLFAEVSRYAQRIGVPLSTAAAVIIDNGLHAAITSPSAPISMAPAAPITATAPAPEPRKPPAKKKPEVDPPRIDPDFADRTDIDDEDMLIWYRDPKNEDERVKRFVYHWRETVDGAKRYPGSIPNLRAAPIRPVPRQLVLDADKVAASVEIERPPGTPRAFWLTAAMAQFVQNDYMRGIDDDGNETGKNYGYETFCRHTEKWVTLAIQAVTERMEAVAP